jgi:hypothetical protein
MARRRITAAAALVLVLSLPVVTRAGQTAPSASGHWEGAIQVPAQELNIQVDLAPAAGDWEGAISIPAQGLKGFPLTTVAVKGNTVTFAMKGVPGDPVFTATLSADGKTLSGTLAQGGGTVPFALTRAGEAKFERPPDSTPITKELEGSWEGALDVQGTTLRLVMKLGNGQNGRATGTLISVDQGGAEIPIASIVQTGAHLKLVVPSIVGSYEGDLKDGQVTGTWTQGSRSLPLVLKRQK